MKNSCLLLILVMTFLGCQNDRKSASNLYQYVPDNTALLIKTNTLERFLTASKNNSLIKDLTVISELNSFEIFKHLKPNNECLIALSKDVTDSLEIVIIAKQDESLLKLDSIPNVISETFQSSQKSISKYNINNSIYYSSVMDSVFFISNRLKLVETSVAKKSTSSNFENLMEVTREHKSASIILDLNKKQFNIPILLHSVNNSSSFSNILVLDIDLNQNDVLINGITKADDSTQSLINVFRNTIPQANTLAQIIPSDTDYFMSLTFNDIKQFEEQLAAYRSTDSISESFYPFETISEAGIAKQNSNEIIILKSIDAPTTLENLSQSIHSIYRTVPIYNFEETVTFETLFSPFFTSDSISNYTLIEDYFLFSSNISTLEYFISNYQNGTTLAESQNFKDIMENLSDESSIFTYVNENGLRPILNNSNTKNYKSSAVQYVYDADFAHVNSIFKTQQSKSRNNAVTEDFNINLDAQILSDIQLVKNHKSNQNDIAIQDVNNNLYLISNKGKVFWKKQINGKILGKIEQMDMFKNGRLQLVFTTANRLYVLDRNGQEVSPFPLKFNDQITQPISVFDYDKKRNYRLMVVQGKNTLMYDQKGKIVSGFKYKKAQSTIATQPKHFRIGRKDYIVFADGDTMEILNRTGKRRVNVKEPIYFSKNEIYLYNNKFTTTNTTGELLEVNQKGSVSHKNLNLNETHFLTTTSKTLVTLSDNKLRIKTNTIDLDFGDYTAPKIFYINNKIYVNVTDRQAKKVYLFDSQAKPISNFPVYGTSAIEMEDIDKDKTIEVITKGDDNSLIIYEIN